MDEMLGEGGFVVNPDRCSPESFSQVGDLTWSNRLANRLHGETRCGEDGENDVLECFFMYMRTRSS